jgi:golgi phosphoprotein 3
MSSGLTRRRGAGGGGEDAASAPSRTASSTNVRDNGPETSYEASENGHKIAFDPRDISESAERSKQPKLTLMEEVILLGLKDKQVRDTLFSLSRPPLSQLFTCPPLTEMLLPTPLWQRS